MNPDGIDNMHVVNGNFFELSCDQCLMFHVQDLIEQHYQQMVKDFFLILTHVHTSPSNAKTHRTNRSVRLL
jgi:hypothetical protein